MTVDRARLWKDGIGIERLPVEVRIGDETVAAVVVCVADLLALEDMLCEASNILAMCSVQGVDWSDGPERAEFFAEADTVWRKVTGTWRGDDEMFEDDDQTRPQ